MKLPTPLIPTDHYHNFLQYGKVRGEECVWGGGGGSGGEGDGEVGEGEDGGGSGGEGDGGSGSKYGKMAGTDGVTGQKTTMSPPSPAGVW